MNDEAKRTRQPSWKIDDPEGRSDLNVSLSLVLTAFTVFNKLVVTTLKYTPIVIEHHAPIKVLASGKM